MLLPRVHFKATNYCKHSNSFCIVKHCSFSPLLFYSMENITVFFVVYLVTLIFNMAALQYIPLCSLIKLKVCKLDYYIKLYPILGFFFLYIFCFLYFILFYSHFVFSFYFCCFLGYTSFVCNFKFCFIFHKKDNFILYFYLLHEYLRFCCRSCCCCHNYQLSLKCPQGV